MAYVIRKKKIRWSELTQEELIAVKELQINSKTAIEARVKIALYTNHYRIIHNIGDVMADSMANAGDNDEDKYAMVQCLYGILNDEKVLVEDLDSAGVVFTIEYDHLRVWALDATTWLDEDNSLISLPFNELNIGSRRYKMPDALLINTTYQQYSNAQRYLQIYWHIVDNLRKMYDSSNPMPKDETQINRLLESADDAQRGFLANILTPIIRTGETLYDDEGKPYESIRNVPRYVADDEDKYKEDMKSADKWLFSVIYQMVQNTLRQYGRKFPDLFSDSSEGDSHKDAFVQELGTINLVIEKGGYPNAAAVMDENAVIVFKRLDMINEEARLTKQAMERSKRGKK
jgi:hypothetical protein